MCGRYTVRRIDLLTRFGATLPADFETFDDKRLVPRFNVAPSQRVPVVRMTGKDARSLGLVKWGLVPSWTKGKPKISPINARAETVATSGMFRQALNRRRCLVPADGFFEWQRLSDQLKQPMFIHMADDRPFAFAGLWERWTPEDGADPVDTMTIVTTRPNALMANIHDRMPVILKDEDHDRWLDRSVSGEGVADLLKPYDAEQMEAWPVSSRVNSPRNDDPSLVEPEAA